jgi:hypothetical protein
MISFVSRMSAEPPESVAPSANIDPTLHDIRHKAAVHRVIAWNRSGQDTGGVTKSFGDRKIRPCRPLDLEMGASPSRFRALQSLTLSAPMRAVPSITIGGTEADAQ